VPQVRKTVGIYERPEKRGGMRTALVVAAVTLLAAAATGLAVFVF
jgi:hypothetical protein